MVDYSKWDKMDIDDDDDDGPRKPRVTKLEGPSRIVLGAQQPPAAGAAATASKDASLSAVGLDYSKWDKLEVSDDDDDDDDDEAEQDDGDAPDAELWPRTAPGSAAAEMAADAREEDALDGEEMEQLRRAQQQGLVAPPPPAPAPVAAAAAASGGPDAGAAHAALVAKLSRNGAVREAYLWSQTDIDAEVSVLLPAGTRAKQLRVELVRDPTDNVSPANERQRLRVRLQGAGSGAARVAFEGSLAYPVAQPDEEDDELAWEVVDFEGGAAGRRALRVSLRKQAVPGVVVWWSRALVDEAEVDTLALPDRKRAPRVAEHAAVWDEAQRMFRERVAAREPQIIDVPELTGPEEPPDDES
jgi:hypothetical protein